MANELTKRNIDEDIQASRADSVEIIAESKGGRSKFEDCDSDQNTVPAPAVRRRSNITKTTTDKYAVGKPFKSPRKSAMGRQDISKPATAKCVVDNSPKK
jgi:hypothetical protein